jgi:putative OPT family oligopeptide transporter
MGVVMMIPLRRAMIIEQKELRYPEGVACAEVLKAGDRGGAEMLGIFSAMAIGALFKALVSIVGVFKETVQGAVRVGPTGFYAGTDISPMLMAVGFIVGWEISFLIFFGGAISFVGVIPVLAWNTDLSSATSLTAALKGIWDTQIRFVGIGAMVVAGVFSIIKISGSMGAAISTAVKGIRGLEQDQFVPRTEQGFTGRSLALLLLVCVVLTAIVYYMMTGDPTTTVITTILMFVLGFFFVAVASYIVGLVGSSNSPVSGMTICTVLVTAGLLLTLNYTGQAGMLATLGVAGVVCCAACTSGDICQDLKIGQIVGATPRRLQIGELLGTVVPAFFIAPTLIVLNSTYGIGVAPADNPDATPLAAPQGVMFQKLVGGFFGEGQIPWHLVGYGAAIGVIAIVIDKRFLEPADRKFRLHPMPLAVGMYLPWTVTMPILLGGLVYLFVDRRSTARGDSAEAKKTAVHRGLLFSSGLVAGEAILGILIAVILFFSNLRMPFIAHDWANDNVVSLVSLAALFAVMAMLARKSLARGAPGS